MHFCFSCISYLSFGTEITGETKPQMCQILTNNNTLDRFIGYIVFAERGHQRTMEIMMLIKNIGKSVKFIGSKYIQESLINMSLQLYISYLNKHIVTLHHVSLRLLRSVNTLNSKLKFKTILINKSQLLLKALYLEATLTFLRFAAKHCLIAQLQLFGGSYQLYGAICFIFQTLQREIV